MPARQTDRTSDPLPIASAAFVLLAMLIGTAAHAQPTTLYDTRRILQHKGNECVGVPTCQSMKLARTIIDAGQNQVLTYNCPGGAPHLVGWDTEQSEHIQVSALPGSLNQTASTGNGTVNEPLILAADNRGSESGYVIIFLGCSVDPVAPVAMMRHRSGVPSNAGIFLGDN